VDLKKLPLRPIQCRDRQVTVGLGPLLGRERPLSDLRREMVTAVGELTDLASALQAIDVYEVVTGLSRSVLDAVGRHRAR
jgi:hypothetical protein